MALSSYKTIDEYIQMFPEDVKEKLEKMRAVIREEAPDALETISYQLPTLRLRGKNLVHFAAFKDHISFFPTPIPIEIFKDELTPYNISKGTIQFQNDQDIPYSLIRKIVRFRIGEIDKQK